MLLMRLATASRPLPLVEMLRCVQHRPGPEQEALPRLVHPSEQVELCLTCLQGHPLAEQEACSDLYRGQGWLV